MRFDNRRQAGPWSKKLVEDTILRWKGRFPLSAWEFSWEWKDDEVNSATFRPTYGREVALLLFDRSFACRYEDLWSSICHEMLHACFNRAASTVENVNRAGILGSGEYALFFESWKEAYEHDLDNLARFAAGPERSIRSRGSGADERSERGIRSNQTNQGAAGMAAPFSGKE